MTNIEKLSDDNYKENFPIGTRVAYIGKMSQEVIGLTGTVIKEHPQTNYPLPNSPSNINVKWDKGIFMGVYPGNLVVIGHQKPDWEI